MNSPVVSRRTFIRATAAGALALTRSLAADPERFGFIVIGDTGEGDVSQQVLRDQLLKVAGTPLVRFVVI